MPESVIDIFRTSYNSLLNLLPYLMIGILISEALRFLPWNRIVASGPLRSPALLTLFMAVAGIFSPLCTYGTLPIIMTMKRNGFPLAPLISFLSASSLMNPQLFLLTWGGIHPPIAIARTLAALLFSLTLGLLLRKIPEQWILKPGFKEKPSEPECGQEHRFNPKDFMRRYVKTLEFVGFYVVLGILIGSVIEVLVPPAWIQIVFRSNIYTAVLTAAILGVPLYACGGGAIPMVRSLMATGMQPGAALAFFIVGPATRITPLIALSTMLRLRFIAAYIGALILFALIAGMIYAVPYDPIGIY